LGFSVVVEGVETETRHTRVASGWLAARLTDGDPLASRELVKRHQAELYRYAFAGEMVEYPLDLSRTAPFQRRILEVVRVYPKAESALTSGCP
jgi:hypothetical protein